MTHRPPRLGRRAGWLSALAILLCGCAGADATRPVETAPVITVGGVTDGATYSGPVTVSIDVDRGSYTAQLNGSSVIPPVQVRDPGRYELVVTARDGQAVASRTVHFDIEIHATGTLVIRVFDLGDNDSGGGGDAILLTDSSAAGSFSALVDAGPHGAAQDEGYVADRLRALGVDTLQLVVLSHAHSDHFAGLPAVLTSIHVKRFAYNGQPRSLSFYQSLLRTARERADTVEVIGSEETLRLSPADSSVALTLLPPLPRYLGTDFDRTSDPDESHMLNEGSIGVLVSGGGAFRGFLAGDGEVEANRRWMNDFSSEVEDVTLLKVGHHGANNAIFDNGFSGPSSWLAFTDPEVAIVSANGTTHPRLAALDALLGRTRMRTYCTNVHGDIVMRVRPDGTYAVTTQKNSDANCVAGTDATS